MLLSVGYLIFFGFLGNVLFKFLKLPGLLGMLFVGMLLGPYGFDLLDESLLMISADLRMIALIVILLRAGFGLNRMALKKVGKTAIWMGFIPALLEGFALLAFAMFLFDFSFAQAGILGFIIAAVSPAVVVPSMLRLIEKKMGVKKQIPVLILGAASLDDVIVITLFSTFIGIYFGTEASVVMSVIGIPVAVFLGILLGLIMGVILIFFFNRFSIRDSQKVLLILAISIFMVSLEHLLENVIMIAALLGVMTLGLVITELKPKLGNRLSIKFNKVWVFAEVLLFVLVGAVVDVSLAVEAGFIGILLIMFGLMFRGLGVMLSTIRSNLNYKERLFAVLAYTPKATVQAAIGAVPLSLGVAQGEMILALSVLSIIITAPIGAILINKSAPYLLSKDE